MKRLLLLTIVAAVIGFSSQAMAYSFIAPGCGVGGAAWPSNLLPAPWSLNMNGYTGMNSTQVQSAMTTGFAEWGTPCCSSWTASYAGTTNEQFGQGGDNTIIFYHQGWPSSLGSVNTTIGVTSPLAYSDCTIRSADMAFNATGFTFIEGQPQLQTQADFQSIATHEIGHFLGLGHIAVSPAGSANCTVPGGTMCPAYSNGIAERDLSQDDINGVCTLYETSCGCSGDGDCSNNQVCVNSMCQDPPCSGNGDCDPGETCQNMQCVRDSCQVNADCDSGFSCSGGQCFPEQDCVVCQTCDENADCAGGAGICAQFQGLGSGVCTQLCDNGLACPGDSVCVTFQDGNGNEFPLCVNPGAEGGGEICPAAYSCTGTNNTGCPSAGTSCSNMGANCGTDTEFCVRTSENDTTGICSCSCVTDSDCGDGNVCVPLGDGSSACIPDPCSGVTCGADEVCSPTTGDCVASGCPSLGNSCANQGAQCGADTTVCVSTGPNDTTGICSCNCTQDSDCGTGRCLELTNGDSACFPGPCADTVCPLGQICEAATGDCIDAPEEDMGTPDMSTGDMGITDMSQDVDPGTDASSDVSVDDTGMIITDTGENNQSKGDDDCGCSTVRTTSSELPMAPLGLLLAGLGFVVLRRRKR